jgi:DnaJ-class molecular chaperone
VSGVELRICPECNGRRKIRIVNPLFLRTISFFGLRPCRRCDGTGTILVEGKREVAARN